MTPGQISNLSIQDGNVTAQQRMQRSGHTGLVVWLTGLSGSGKTTIAIEVERVLFEQGWQVARLDGDHLRQGLCADLGFSLEDRVENIRRAGEVARLFHDAGLVVLAAFISPTRAMRSAVRQRLLGGHFLEVYVRASLQACIERDPKGFYARALRGEIPRYTGLDQDYEEPDNPELVLDTEAFSEEQCAQALLGAIRAAAGFQE